jgi:hypothetical protein
MATARFEGGREETYRYYDGICIATDGFAVVMILTFETHLKALNEQAEMEEQERGLPKSYRCLL